ncbi:MAG TPA: ATP-binding protein [Candidatus Solibacter sp.]|nr:ATP-binding protein [Candidatus Solibacter sp.]
MSTPTVCGKCHGTGWIIVERANVSGAEACECRAEGRTERAEERSQIPPLYRAADFENFSKRGNQELSNVLIAVRTYAEAFPLGPKPGGLLLIGEPGTGKTHLAVAALRRIIRSGREGIFSDYQTLLERIRSGYDATSNSSDREAYRTALDADVLLLDDLGAHRVTDWVQDTVTSIITHRCNNKKPLIATTNLPDPEAKSVLTQRGPLGVEYRRTLADHIGERARSRLFEMCQVIKMPAVEDYRIREGKRF